MITKKHTALVALAACALTLAAVGSDKNPVTRPFRVQGSVTLTINLQDGAFTVEGTGVATHTGLFTAVGSGSISLTSHAASGTSTGADGDAITWVMPSLGTFVFTGGTGRFANCSGGFNYVWQSAPAVSFPDATTELLTYSYIGVGQITY